MILVVKMMGWSVWLILASIMFAMIIGVIVGAHYRVFIARPVMFNTLRKKIMAEKE